MDLSDEEISRRRDFSPISSDEEEEKSQKKQTGKRTPQHIKKKQTGKRTPPNIKKTIQKTAAKPVPIPTMASVVEPVAPPSPPVPEPARPRPAAKLTPEMAAKWTSTFGGKKPAPVLAVTPDVKPPTARAASPPYCPPTRPVEASPRTPVVKPPGPPVLPVVKQEPGLELFLPPIHLNYSQMGEDEVGLVTTIRLCCSLSCPFQVITLGDSEEEDGYDATHSQSMLGLQEEVDYCT